MKHTNLYAEIKMHKPDTSWHTTLVAVVIMVAVCGGIYVAGLLGVM